MSHMLVYGADELHFLKAIALVMWFLIAAFSKKAGKGVQYSLVFIKGSASGTRLACFPIAKQGNGVDLAPPGEGVRLRISVA